MTRGDLRTSSQLFALVVGLVTSVPVYWECLVIMPLRWVARRASGEGESRRWSLKFWKRQESRWGTDAEMTTAYLRER